MGVNDFIIAKEIDQLAVESLEISLGQLGGYVNALKGYGFKFQISNNGAKPDNETLLLREKELLHSKEAVRNSNVFRQFFRAFYDTLMSDDERNYNSWHYQRARQKKKLFRNSFISKTARHSSKDFFTECATAYFNGKRAKLMKKDPAMFVFLEEVFEEVKTEDKSIDELLNTAKLPEPKKTKSNRIRVLNAITNENLNLIVERLYGAAEIEAAIPRFKIKDKTKPVLEVSVQRADGIKKIFIKTTREGRLREGVTTELNNLLTGREVPYLLFDNLIVIAEIPGGFILPLNLDENDRNYAFQYGMLEENCRPIGLEERDYSNIRVMENGERWNIDFGQGLQHDSSKRLRELYICDLPIPNNIVSVEKGAMWARRKIRQRMLQNMARIRTILKAIDTEGVEKLEIGYKFNTFEKTKHPREILTTYAKNNGWKDIERMLWR